MDNLDNTIIESSQSTGGVRGDLNYRLLIMRQIDRCGMILSKLPSEYSVAGQNTIAGTTFGDIQEAFYSSVRLLEALLKAYKDEEYDRANAELIARYNEGNAQDPEDFYLEKYANIISLCARLGMMLELTAERMM